MWILGSHNSWSYLPVKRWWMVPFRFTARCQDLSIIEQYNLGVRCFDLRVRFNKKGELLVCHGFIKYNIDKEGLYSDLEWLSDKKDVYIRLLHEARNKKQYNSLSIKKFREFCKDVLNKFPNIKFWNGINLYNWTYDFAFYHNPSCEEKYSSVCDPRLIDDWYPRLFAKVNNKEIVKKGTDKDILLIDFVNYGY